MTSCEKNNEEYKKICFLSKKYLSVKEKIITFESSNNLKKEIMETLKVTSNQSKRTFTIRKYINGSFFVKYRTTQMSKPEFENNENNTENDWKNFLRSTDDYYKV